MSANGQFEAYCVKCRGHTTAVNGYADVAKNGQNMLKGQCPTCGGQVNKFVSGRNGNMQAALTAQRRATGAGTGVGSRPRRAAPKAAAAPRTTTAGGAKKRMTKKQQMAALYGAAPQMPDINSPYGYGSYCGGGGGGYHDDEEEDELYYA